MRLKLLAAVLLLGLGLVLLLRHLSPALSTPVQLCTDSPAPGLYALLHGHAMAKGRRQEAPITSGGSASGSSHGFGGKVRTAPLWSLDLHYAPPPCPNLHSFAPWAHRPKENCRPQKPPPPPDKKAGPIDPYNGDLRRAIAEAQGCAWWPQ